MNLTDPTSLVNSLDNLNQHLLIGETVPADQGLELAHWIVTRQGQKGSYRGMFAPTPGDFEHGIRLFTGERLQSASARHIMGQEAARALWLFGSQDSSLRTAYSSATAWMHSNPEFDQTGTFCCGRCTLAYWRHYSVGDFQNRDQFLQRGLLKMRGLRIGDGQWQTLTFYYAIYTLSELDLELARVELNYARHAIQARLKRLQPGEYSLRRRAILLRALELTS
jgi:hypothetical protein